MEQIPAKTAAAEEMSKDLKKRGFRFVGPTICYAFMQAAGMVTQLTSDGPYGGRASSTQTAPQGNEPQGNDGYRSPPPIARGGVGDLGWLDFTNPRRCQWSRQAADVISGSMRFDERGERPIGQRVRVPGVSQPVMGRVSRPDRDGITWKSVDFRGQWNGLTVLGLTDGFFERSHGVDATGIRFAEPVETVARKLSAQGFVVNADGSERRQIDKRGQYGDFDGVRDAFLQFVENVPFYGFAVMCLDHPEVQAMVGRIEDRQVITYGQNRQADVRFFDLRTQGAASVFSVELRDRVAGTAETVEDLSLPMPGLHNVSNATAAIAVAWKLGISPEQIRKGLAAFRGVKRRFTHTGSADGIEVFDDYAHHPVEIRAVLSAARAVAPGKVVAVVQPHRYTRLESLFDEFSACFNDADHVVCAPVYAAGEAPREGIDHHALANGIRASGHRSVHAIGSEDELAGTVARIAEPGDYVVCLGAGSISQWAQLLPEALTAARGGAGA